jgi:hypothetical protein
MRLHPFERIYLGEANIAVDTQMNLREQNTVGHLERFLIHGAPSANESFGFTQVFGKLQC